MPSSWRDAGASCPAHEAAGQVRRHGDVDHLPGPPAHRRGHVPHPPARPGAGRTGRHARQLARDPGRRAGDRRHQRQAAARAVGRAGLRARRAAGREVDLPLPRRHRPRRQPRHGARAVPERDARHQLVRDRADGRRDAAADRPPALGRQRRVVRRRRPHVRRRPPADVGLPHHPRPVRHQDRRLLVERCLRHAGPRPRRRRRRDAGRDARRDVHGVLLDAQPVARGRRRGQVRRLGRPGRRAGAVGHRRRPRPAADGGLDRPRPRAHAHSCPPCPSPRCPTRACSTSSSGCCSRPDAAGHPHSLRRRPLLARRAS